MNEQILHRRRYEEPSSSYSQLGQTTVVASSSQGIGGIGSEAPVSTSASSSHAGPMGKPGTSSDGRRSGKRWQLVILSVKP